MQVTSLMTIKCRNKLGGKMSKGRMIGRVFLAGVVTLCILLPVFLSCGDGGDNGKPSAPKGIKGFPATLTMGEPFDLRKNITINLPHAPNATIDDIKWSNQPSGQGEFPTTQIVIEDGMFIPVTFFPDPVKVYAVVKSGDGDMDYVETITTNIVFPLNPFIGTWSGSDGKTWKFNTDGTFDIDTSANTGSFAVWSGRPSRKFLVTVSGDPSEITVQNVTGASGVEQKGVYQPYCFEVSGNTIKITPIEFDYTAYNKQDARSFEENGAAITLTRQSGAPAALDLLQNDSAKMMIGGWVGNFATTSFDFDNDNSITGVSSVGVVTAAGPSLTYYADGRVRQNYEGAWLKRGEVFITVGNDGRRWDPPALAAWSTGEAKKMNDIKVVKIDEYRTGEAGTPYSRGTNTSLFWRIVKFPEGGQDNYVPVANSFTGVWKASENEYWQFNKNGTGGKAATAAGPFSDDFSFLVFTGSYSGTTTMNPNPSIVILEGTDTITVTRYELLIKNDKATLTNKTTEGEDLSLDWVSGKGEALSLTNPLIGGEIAAVWSPASGAINGSWSIKYNADGTVRLYHHQAGHQFVNSYALRGDTLVIFGSMRFAANPIVATITNPVQNNTWQVTETGSTSNKWIYTKVAGVPWKAEGGVTVVQPLADSYVPTANPFIGVWKNEADSKYWEFRTDGTGGYAATATGEFSDEFSFLVTATGGGDTALIMLNDDDGSVTVTSYIVTTDDDEAILTPSSGTAITLKQESGTPQILSLENDLLGELSTVWLPASGTVTASWSVKYRADGSVQFYRQQQPSAHQANVSYALRGDTLVIYGAEMTRFSTNPVVATVSSLISSATAKDTWQVTETSGTGSLQTWIYTKISAALWETE
jgi:hypothetical protein